MGLKSNLAQPVTWSTNPSISLYNAASGGAVTTTGDTVYLRRSDFGSNNSVQIIATVNETGVGTFTDTVRIIRLEEGVSSLDIQLSNEAHTYPSDKDGVIDPADYASGANTIKVYEGTSALTIGTGDGQFDVTATGTGITVGASSSSSGTDKVFDSFSNMTASIASVIYTISGKRLDGSPFSITRVQSFTKAVEGGTGQSFRVISASQIFQEDTSGTRSPSTIELKAIKNNILDDVTWSSTAPEVEFYADPADLTPLASGAPSDTVYVKASD